ncbi:MAG: Dabb family protein [Candidatus Hydrogenedentes bacterium]|nr:Dabb family protein [Candidatus Hydrogenedentota bacterium]
MKRTLVVGMALVALGLSVAAVRVNAVEKEEDVKVLRHIVMFKYADEASAKAISEAFVALKQEIDLIKDFEWGTNVSKEGLDKGLTHAYTLTFHSQEDLDAYIVHEAHKAFVAKLDGKVTDVCVFDYWAQ